MSQSFVYPWYWICHGLDMKRIQNEIKRISEQRSHQEPQFWDVFDSAIPYVVYCIDMNIQNRKRRKEIHIHAVLLKNCSLDRSCVLCMFCWEWLFVALPVLPLPITPLFGESSSYGILDDPMKTQVSVDESTSNKELASLREPDYLWGSVNPESGSLIRIHMISSSLQLLSYSYFASRIETITLWIAQIRYVYFLQTTNVDWTTSRFQEQEVILATVSSTNTTITRTNTCYSISINLSRSAAALSEEYLISASSLFIIFLVSS